MKNHSTQLLQKSISRVFPGSTTQSLAEVFFLFFTGVLAMALHSRLRIPMHLPGKQGFLFMFIIISASLLSRYRFSTLLAVTGSASLLMTGFGAFSDPFMPVNYLLLGFVMDLLISSPGKYTSKLWYVALSGGLSFSLIPLSRGVISLISGLPYPSLMNGVLSPWFTHFLFGFSGSLLAAIAINTLSAKK